MNNFKEWLWQTEFERLISELFECCVINEALGLKIPNDPQRARDRLINHIKYRNEAQPDGKLDNAVLINNIRHLFTNYDDEWKSFERTKTNSDLPVPVQFIHPLTKQSSEFDLGDPCDHFKYWNTLVAATADLVDHIIERITSPKNHPKLKLANKEWLNSKMRRSNC